MVRSVGFRRASIQIVATAIMLLSVKLATVAAEEPKLDFQAVSQEMIKMRKEGNSITMAFWMPSAYWEMNLGQEPRLTKSQVKTAVDALRPYTIVAVVDGDVEGLGTLKFRPESAIRESTRLIDSKGNSYEPLAEDDVEVNARVFLGAFKPAMAAVVGPLGKNMHVLLFPGKGQNADWLADPKAKGSLVVKIDKHEFRWKLPLGSLLPPKHCPKCKETGSGAWEFCPWCGSKLSNSP
jgi:hypothetical protein